MKPLIVAALASLTLAGCDSAGGGGQGGARQQIRIVGSSTVYPFSTAVAERFTQGNAGLTAPIVESTGTGAGFKLFCAGVGTQHPDITNASRRMKPSELEDCKKNGVNQVVEVPIGIDGLVLIESREGARNYALSTQDVYEALAANPYGKPNTAKVWRDVNPALPAVPISVYGPPPTSGTRDSFAELIMEAGCDENPEMVALKASDSNRHKDICTKIREDGAFIEAGENDNLLVQKVTANPGTIGVLGYSFFEENQGALKAIPLGGAEPNSQTISSLQYPGARQMFIYVKGEHVNAVPGLKEYLAEYARGWAEGGYLTQRGLIASPADVRTRAQDAVTKLTPVNAAELS